VHAAPAEIHAVVPPLSFSDLPCKPPSIDPNLKLLPSTRTHNAQVVTQYGDHDVPHVLEACERMEAHLTAAGGDGLSRLRLDG